MKKSPARNVHLKKGPSKLLEKINSSIEIDSRLYKEDIEGSVAHAKMLIKTKIIKSKEGKQIISALFSILKDIEKNKVKFSSSYEDIHMNIEFLLQVMIFFSSLFKFLDKTLFTFPSIAIVGVL